MGEVAREREQAVVRVGVTAHRTRSERADEPLHEGHALNRGRFGRRQEPRCRVEEVGRGAAGPTGDPAGDRVAGDEARVGDRGERTLRRGDVGHDDVPACGVQHLLHKGGRGADRNRDHDELGVRDRIGERGGRLHTTAGRGAFEHGGIGVEAATARAGAAGSEGHRGPDEPRADDGKTLDGAWPIGSRFRRGGYAPGRRDLLLQHVEDCREDRVDRSFAERALVRGDEGLQQLRLALGIDPALPGRVLVVADGGDELESPVQKLEEAAVELRDLAAESFEVAHSTCFSPASIASGSRFAGGASGQTQPGSYEQDGL
jgi:hypothetical protein